MLFNVVWFKFLAIINIIMYVIMYLLKPGFIKHCLFYSFISEKKNPKTESLREFGLKKKYGRFPLIMLLLITDMAICYLTSVDCGGVRLFHGNDRPTLPTLAQFILES